jgi:pimeloyl-ACP methyl ester carboxylesterase
VFALDYRGHGDSTAPADGSFDWTRMADDLLAVIDLVATGPIDLFGHSMGGAVAMLAEERRPGTLRSASLYEPIILPPPAGTPPVDNQLSTGAARRRSSFPSKADALLRYASRPPLDALRAGSLADYVEHGFAIQPDGSVRLKCAPEHEAATFDAPGKPTFDTLRAIATPVTVAIGSVSPGWTPAELGPSIVEALPRARLEPHPHLGHFGPLEDPGAVARSVLASAGA